MSSFIRLVAFVRLYEWAAKRIEKRTGSPWSREAGWGQGQAGRDLFTPGCASGAYAVGIYCAEKRKTFAMSKFVCSALWRSKSKGGGLKRGA